MEAHFGKKDSGPPRSIEDEPDFQALVRIARRLEPDQQLRLLQQLQPQPHWITTMPDDDTPKETNQYPRLAAGYDQSQ